MSAEHEPWFPAPPFPDEIGVVVMFRNPDGSDPKSWRVFAEAPTRPSAEQMMRDAMDERPFWEFALAESTRTWTWLSRAEGSQPGSGA